MRGLRREERRLMTYGRDMKQLAEELYDVMTIQDPEELKRLRAYSWADALLDVAKYAWQNPLESAIGTGKFLGDFALDWAGGIGDVKALVEGLRGETLLRGDPLSGSERLLTGLGAIPFIPPLAGAVKGLKRVPVGDVAKQGNLGKIEGLMTRNKFGESLSLQGRKILKWYDRNRGVTAVHFNSKTGMSIDFSTSCPKRLDPSFGPCPYCYVEHGRVADKLYKMKGANKNITDTPYNNEILNWSNDLIEELNRDGGIRMFSFGDYRPTKDFLNVSQTLEDARRRGLLIKAITKQPEFIKTFGNHPNMRINISTDNVPRPICKNAPTINQALKLKSGRDNIKIRAVALNPEEAIKFTEDPRIDVVTLYHGLTNFDPNGVRHNKLLNIIKDQNPSLVKKVGEKQLQDYTDTWVNMNPRSDKFRKIAAKYPNKICCQGGKCSRDPTKCGFGFSAMLIAGVLLPELRDSEN